jgi:hypothetical protein
MELGQVVTEGHPDEVDMVSSRRAPATTAAEGEA